VTEPVPQPPPPQTMHEPRDPEAELARKNLVFGLVLFGIFCLLFAGTVVVALIYLAVD
jgi:hypothetical protein